MSAPRTDMRRLQELVRLYRMGVGARQRARLLRMSTRTDREYREAIAAAGLLEGIPAEPPEMAELKAAVEAAKPPPEPRKVPSSIEPWLAEIRKATEAGAGPQAIWDRLRRMDPSFTASVSAVKRAVRRIRRDQGVQAKDVVIPVETEAGDVAQVDFGYAGRLFDPDSGLVRKAWVFVVVLGFSRHLFAKIVFDQKAETWLALHVEAFRWFGGVPRTLVPDNLKAAVIRAAFGAGDRHELALNRSYRELARYYGCKIDPTPVRSPQKKGKVESAVKYVCRNFLAAGAFERITDANSDLALTLLDRERPGAVSVAAGCRLMGLARSSYNYQPEMPAEEDLACRADLRDRIEAICAEFPRYGYRRVTAQLKREGRVVNHKRVARIIREEALSVRSLKHFTVTTDSRHKLPVYPNRLSEAPLSGPDQVWQADITYIRIATGFVFLAVILDAWSRRVVGYALGRRIDTQLTL